MLQKTVLYDIHKKLGAKMVEFGGWEMPLQYSGIIDEHKTVRNTAGMFDVSHMGQFFVFGIDALSFLQKIVPQDISALKKNHAVYCQLTNNNAGIIDDIIVYYLDKNSYLIVVNAANIEKDYKWIVQNISQYDVEIKNKSQEYSMFALQGPEAHKIIQNCGISEADQPEFFTIKETQINNIPVFLSRTGYTGEDGFEIITKNENAINLWNFIFENGIKYGLKPIGLGARDTLRLEAALMLYGNDLNEATTPVEAGLKWSLALDKKSDYNGKDAILKQLQNGISKKLIGFEMTEKAIARHEYDIYQNQQKIGIVTSGGYSPTLDKNIGMGYVYTVQEIKTDSIIEIMIRNKLYKAKVVKRPFVKKKYRNKIDTL